MTAILLAVALQAVPAQAGSWGRVKYFGEGGGTNPATTGGAADCLENCGRAGGIIEEAPPSRDAGAGSSSSSGSSYGRARSPVPLASGPAAQASAPALPRAGAPAPRRIGGFVPRDPASRRYAAIEARRETLSDAVSDSPARAPAEQAKPYSLWSSVSQPLEMTAAKVQETGLDEAESAARTEYERRILGSRTARPGSASSQAPALDDPAFAPPPAGDIFVSVDLAASERDGLKDAVAGLGSAAGFRMDARFPPQASLAGPAQAARATSVRGWLPADKLGEVVKTPGVLRVELDRGAPRPEYGGATTSLVVGVRIPDGAAAGESFRRTVGELALAAGFQWTRTIGFEAVPNSKDVALVVVGDLPLSRLPRLLEHPSVIKVAPAPLVQSAPVPAPRPTRLARFLDYTREHSPLLLALTLLLLLPSVGGLLLRLGQTFIPYQR